MNNENTSMESLAPVYSFRSEQRADIPPSESFSHTLRDGTRRFLRRNGITLAALVFLALWTWTVTTIAAHDARVDTVHELEAAYEARIAAFYEEQEAAQREAEAALDPYLQQLDADATLAAKLLSGVEGYHYDSDSKRTLLRCVFNRVANPTYPATLEEVIRESGQWIQFHETNPVYEADFQFALEEIDAWHNETRLPCSTDFVFADFTTSEIVLRDTFYKTAATRYWRYS